jgi:hypothetical protein
MLYLLLVERRKTKKEKRNSCGGGDFFPRAGHVLLAVLHRFLQLLGAIKC